MSASAASAGHYDRCHEYDDYGALQPVPAHASQQLAWVPTWACPSLGALHWAAPCLIEHFVTPFLFVRQHVTKPDLPQIELAAHCLMVRARVFDTAAVFAARATHLTYLP